MFYNFEVLNKKGKLARVWLAAHYDKKLNKQQILNTNLVKAVDVIIGDDQVPMALRLLGHLLLGIAKLYARKSDYLLKDCNDAIVHIKLAFRPGGKQTVQKRKKKTNTATSGAITLRDPMEDITFDLNVPIEDLGDITLNIDDNDLEFIDFASGELPSHIAPYEDITNVSGGNFTDPALPDPLISDRIDSIDILPGSGDPSMEIPLNEAPTFMDIDDINPLEPEPPTDINILPPVIDDIDPNADKEDAAEAQAKRVGGREVKVTSDRRTTTISAEEMRNYINDTEILEREMEYVPTTREQMDRLAFRYTDSENIFNEFSITNTAGIAPEISDLFRNASNLFSDIPQIENNDDEVDLQDTTIPHEDFNLPNYMDNDVPDYNIPSDNFVSPQRPESPEIARRDSSFGVENDTVFEENRFSVDDISIPSSTEKIDEPEQFIPHQSFSKRTTVMHKFLSKAFSDDKDELCYQDLVQDKKKSTVAQTFFELLVLKSRNVVDLKQDTAYGDITITKTEHFNQTLV